MLLRRTATRALVLLVIVGLYVGALAQGVRAQGIQFRFAVMADSRSDSPNPGVNLKVLRQLVSDMNTFHPAFCLFPGDLVYGGKVGSGPFKRQLQKWLVATGEFRATFYVTPGNHEFRGGAGRADTWREMFPNMPDNGPPGVQSKSNYYFNYGNSRFIGILSDWEDGKPRVDQTWLDEILEASSGFEHSFVFSHHPIRDLGGVKGAFWQSLVSHHVDAYFCGHLHYYNRSQPGDDDTWQVIVGTAGAAQYAPAPGVTGTTIPNQYGFATVDVDGPNVKVTFYGDADGDGHYNDVMDTFFLAAPRGVEQTVPSVGPVGQSAATVEKRGCLMPGF